MPSILVFLYFGVLIEQLYALNYQFPQPDGGIRHPGRHSSLIVCSLGCAVSTLYPILLGSDSPTLANPLGRIAAVCFLSSLSLFYWTARTTQPGRFSVIFGAVQPELVVTHGPFAYIRHPTYVSYTLAWIGAIAMSIGGRAGFELLLPVALGFFAGLLWLYRQGAEQEEGEFRNEAKTVQVSEQYEAYKGSVRARWIPYVV